MNRPTAGAPVAVTGIGVVAPNGIGAAAFWKATQAGESVLDRVTRQGCEHLPVRVAGEVRGFEPGELVEDRFLVQTDRFSHYALAAADLALEHARLGRADYEDDPYAVGVVTAAGSGGGEFGQRELQRLWGQGPRYVGPYQSIAWFYAASTGQVSIRRGFKGPCGVVASDEAGGLDAFAHAARGIRQGSRAMLVGATEAPLAPYSVVCQLGYEGLSTAEDPERAYRPFTAKACGFVPAEGGAMFTVEDTAAAERRGRRCGPCWRGTRRPSPGRAGRRSRARAWPTRSAARCGRRGWLPRRWTWSSPTPWVRPRRTRRRRGRSGRRSARTARRCR